MSDSATQDKAVHVQGRTRDAYLVPAALRVRGHRSPRRCATRLPSQTKQHSYYAEFSMCPQFKASSTLGALPVMVPDRERDDQSISNWLKLAELLRRLPTKLGVRVSCLSRCGRRLSIDFECVCPGQEPYIMEAAADHLVKLCEGTLERTAAVDISGIAIGPGPAVGPGVRGSAPLAGRQLDPDA